jgi:hypothetical protein
LTKLKIYINEMKFSSRYTAPIIAAHYPFPYLHGGLILGPVPKLAAPQKDAAPQAPQVPENQYQQQPQDEVEYEEDPKPYGYQDEVRPIQQLPLPQYRRKAQQATNSQPAAFRRRISLPQGAFEDDDTESVRVEAQDGELEDEA